MLKATRRLICEAHCSTCSYCYVVDDVFIVLTVCAPCNVISHKKYVCTFSLVISEVVCRTHYLVNCCSLISCFLGMSLSDFEMVAVAQVITGIILLSHSTCTEFLFYGVYILESS